MLDVRLDVRMDALPSAIRITRFDDFSIQ